MIQSGNKMFFTTVEETLYIKVKGDERIWNTPPFYKVFGKIYKKHL